jgi:hypothetical protein
LLLRLTQDEASSALDGRVRRVEENVGAARDDYLEVVADFNTAKKTIEDQVKLIENVQLDVDKGEEKFREAVATLPKPLGKAPSCSVVYRCEDGCCFPVFVSCGTIPNPNTPSSCESGVNAGIKS